MISFRYHIVSIVSVFLALAVGVALGGGPLKGEVDNSLVRQVENDRRAKAELQAEIASLRTTNQFGDAFAATVAPGLVGGKLDQRPVALVVLPGADESTVTASAGLVRQAGGTVSGTYRVGEALLDPANKQLVDELGSQLLQGTKDVTVADDASGYERMGALIARAIATDVDEGAPLDEATSGIISGLNTAGLMSAEGDPERRGSLVLVVAGESSGTPEQAQGPNSILTSLVKAIDTDTDGVVVAGPTSTARTGGVIAAIRADVAAASEVSTVDTAARTAGRVVAVLALAGQAAGEAGHFGAIDAADGAMPGAETAPE